jgi:hypothetical protein
LIVQVRQISRSWFLATNRWRQKCATTKFSPHADRHADREEDKQPNGHLDHDSCSGCRLKVRPKVRRNKTRRDEGQPEGCGSLRIENTDALAGVGISHYGGDVHQRCTARTVSTIRGLSVPSSFRLEPDVIRVPLRVLHFLYVSRPLLSPPVVSSLQVLALRSLFLHRHSTIRVNPSWRCGPPKRGLVINMPP